MAPQTTTVFKRVLLIVFIISGNHSLGTNFYFSTASGDDSRNFIEAKNPSTPWKTISKLNEVFGSLQPGDTVFFKRNEVFYGTIHLRASGSSRHPIVISAYGEGEDPVISGWTPLEAWQPAGSGIYKAAADLSLKSHLLMIDGEPREMGRFPNDGFIKYRSGEEKNSLESQLSFGDSDFSGAMLVIRKNHWVIDRHRLSFMDGQNIRFSGESTTDPTDDFGFFFQDHLQTLDKFGEWFHDTASKELFVYFGDSVPSQYNIKVSAMDHLVTNEPHVKYLVLENLCFSGANSDGIRLIEGEGIQIKSSIIEYSGENALTAIAVPHLAVVDNRIHYAQNNGLFLRYGTPNATISGNVIDAIHPFAGMGSNGDRNGIGIHSVSDDAIVELNKLFQIGYSGIAFSGNRTLVKNNYINGFCLIKNDGGGIYTYEGSANRELTGRKVEGNIILNGVGNLLGTETMSKFSKPQVEGIYLDDNASGIEVIGNTVAHVKRNGINIHNARNIRITDNTVFDAHNQLSMAHDHLGDPIRDVRVVGNRFFAIEAHQKIFSVSSIKNDWAEMAQFADNVYSYAQPNGLIFQIRYHDSGKSSHKSLNLDQWAQGPFVDQNFEPILRPSSFTVENILATRIVRPQFKGKNTQDIQCLNDGCGTTLVASDEPDYPAIQVSTSRPHSGIRIDVGAIDGKKQYHLRMRISTDEEFTANMVLRHKGHPWSPISEILPFEIGPMTKNIEKIFSFPDQAETGVVIFTVEGEAATFVINGIEWSEVDINFEEPEMSILYNPTLQPKMVTLPKANFDKVQNEPKEGLELEPFTSKVLFQ